MYSPLHPQSHRQILTPQQAERMDYLEKSQSWKEEQFDLVLQYLRTTLLKRKFLKTSCLAGAAN